MEESICGENPRYVDLWLTAGIRQITSLGLLTARKRTFGAIGPKIPLLSEIEHLAQESEDAVGRTRTIPHRVMQVRDVGTGYRGDLHTPQRWKYVKPKIGFVQRIKPTGPLPFFLAVVFVFQFSQQRPWQNHRHENTHENAEDDEKCGHEGLQTIAADPRRVQAFRSTRPMPADALAKAPKHSPKYVCSMPTETRRSRTPVDIDFGGVWAVSEGPTCVPKIGPGRILDMGLLRKRVRAHAEDEVTK